MQIKKFDDIHIHAGGHPCKLEDYFNVFGSNAFNMLLLLPLDAIHTGPIMASVSPAHVVSVMAGVIATSVVLMGQLYHVEKRRLLIEPDAWLVIAVIFAGLGIVYANSAH